MGYSITVPSAAPVDVVISNQTIETTSSITVRWEPVPCTHRNGDISGYIVMFRELDSGSVYLERRTSGTEVKVTGLKPSTQYEISVAAINSIGTGPIINTSFDTAIIR